MSARNLNLLRKIRWIGGIALASIAGLWLLYALLGNLFIRSGLLENLASDDGEQVLLHYDSAWTWLPGRVTVRGLSLRVQDSNIQFQLGIAHATLRIDLLALTRRTFAASQVRADGVTFHFRHKMLAAQVNQARAAAYPPIPGFADPPLKAPYIDAPLTDANYNLWTVELTDVQATAHDLWFMEWRFLGDAEVSGAFRLKPVRELRVDPTVLHIQNGVFSIGGREVLRAAAGTFETHVGTYAVRSRTGLDVLQQIDARVDVDAKVTSLAPVAAMYLPTVALTRGQGSLAVHAAVNAGRLAATSRLDYQSALVAVDVAQGLVQGDVQAHVAVLADRLVAGILVRAASLTHDGTERAKLHAFAAGADVNSTALWRPFAVESGSLQWEKLAVAHLGAVQDVMPRGVALHGGEAEVSGRADIAPDALTLNADAKLHNAHLGLGKLDVTANGAAHVAWLPNAENHGAHGQGTLALQNTSLRLGDTHADGLWLDGRARGQFLPTLDVQVTLRGGPEDALRRLAVGNAFLPKVVMHHFGGASVRAQGRVRASKGHVAVVVANAKDAGISGSGSYRSISGQGERGDFLVQFGPFNVAITVRGSDVSVKLVGEPVKTKAAPAKHVKKRKKR